MSPRTRSTVTVAAVLAASGLLFTASAQVSDARDGREPEDLAQLVGAESARVERLTAQVNALEAEVAELGAAASAHLPSLPDQLAERESVVSGSLAVEGPGLTVSLDDAPPSSGSIPGVRSDDLVVHQQDVQHVINALWAGGAEAMTLQGERVIATSAFRCSGNIMLLHGKVFSPPYVIEAVGDPRTLQASLDASPGVALYKDYVEAMALGWSVKESDGLELPPYTGSTEMQHAKVPAGTDVFS
jgi:uncharacterized protein YlxW (UPF0749 family)